MSETDNPFAGLEAAVSDLNRRILANKTREQAPDAGDCYRCDLDMHYCGGCGDPLRHDGKQFDGTKHEECA